ncbi:MAG: 4-hydroxy-tetrahydrodipicolinate reductase [Phycisphaerales bacterium]|nr:4-hydroxy-tetrahydrodipicolinate reductase [Phycisphaerales bacterium]
MSVRVGIVGCTGQMGQTLIRLLAEEKELRLASAVTMPGDPHLGADAGLRAGVGAVGVAISTELSEVDVAIEFTLPAGCMHWVAACATRGIALVSGTTGLGPAEQATLAEAARRIPIVWAPNMSVGVNLLLALVEDVAARLGDAWDVEIIEAHHRRKVDAPSGTADALLRAVAAGRQRDAAEISVFGRRGHVGPRPAGEVGVHAVRLGSIVGAHDVHFASEEEVVTLSHQALSRAAFARGALRAARWIGGRPPGLYSMRAVLLS